MNALSNYLQRLRLRTKLLLSVGCLLFLAFAIGAQGVMNTRAANDQMDDVYESDLIGVSHIKEANINLIYMGRSLRQMMLALDTEEREEAYLRLKLAEKTLRLEFADAKKGVARESGRALVAKFETAFARHLGHVERAIVQIRQDPPYESIKAARWVSSTEFTTTLNLADDLLTAISVDMTASAKNKLEAIRLGSERTEKITVSLIVLGALLGTALITAVGSAIALPIEQLNTSLQALAQGQLRETIPFVDYTNEMGEMARSLQVLQVSSQGMSDLSWVKDNANTITQAIASLDEDVVFASTLIHKLAGAMNVPLAAFYRWDATSMRYCWQGGYGYQAVAQHATSFARGEGLVGQCALEHQTLILHEVPPNYIHVTSGLGNALPRSVLLKPVAGQGGVVLAVMEFASFDVLDTRSQKLLDELMPLIALSLEKLDRQALAKDLLLETQLQSADLQVQAESLRRSEVELRDQRDQWAQQSTALKLTATAGANA